MIEWRRLSLDYYAHRVSEGDYFAFAGYSDAEWYCILGHDVGKLTGAGQMLDSSVGRELLGIVSRRQGDPDFMIAVPECLWHREDCLKEQIPYAIEAILGAAGVRDPVFYERDTALDEAAEHARLFPLIEALRGKRVTLIGNYALRDLRDVVAYDDFIELPQNNLHLQSDVLRDVCNCIRDQRRGGVYLISAGISAALIIDRCWDAVPQSTFVDCGSIWDAFVGIGSQREWRRQLYMRPERLIEWRRKNCERSQ